MMRNRSLLTTALLLGALYTSAQTAGDRFYRTTAEIDRTALKFVIEAVTDLDPNARVLHSDDYRILNIKANASVSDAEVRAAIAAAGVSVDPGTPDMSSYLPAPSADTPPLYRVTGNELQDRARYREAAEAWNQAHPDRSVAVDPLQPTNR